MLITTNQPLRAYAKTPMPVVESATNEVLSLPVHPGFEKDDLGRIVGSLKGFYA
jgi:dTDP-4-amino-4,6-dideoxygalactose transaminase